MCLLVARVGTGGSLIASRHVIGKIFSSDPQVWALTGDLAVLVRAYV
jgi:hypothetical protein